MTHFTSDCGLFTVSMQCVVQEVVESLVSVSFAAVSFSLPESVS